MQSYFSYLHNHLDQVVLMTFLMDFNFFFLISYLTYHLYYYFIISLYLFTINKNPLELLMVIFLYSCLNLNFEIGVNFSLTQNDHYCLIMHIVRDLRIHLMANFYPKELLSYRYYINHFPTNILHWKELHLFVKMEKIDVLEIIMTFVIFVYNFTYLNFIFSFNF